MSVKPRSLINSLWFSTSLTYESKKGLGYLNNIYPIASDAMAADQVEPGSTSDSPFSNRTAGGSDADSNRPVAKRVPVVSSCPRADNHNSGHRAPHHNFLSFLHNEGNVNVAALSRCFAVVSFVLAGCGTDPCLDEFVAVGSLALQAQFHCVDIPAVSRVVSQPSCVCLAKFRAERVLALVATVDDASHRTSPVLDITSGPLVVQGKERIAFRCVGNCQCISIQTQTSFDPIAAGIVQLAFAEGWPCTLIPSDLAVSLLSDPLQVIAQLSYSFDGVLASVGITQGVSDLRLNQSRIAVLQSLQVPTFPLYGEARCGHRHRDGLGCMSVGARQTGGLAAWRCYC